MEHSFNYAKFFQVWHESDKRDRPEPEDALCEQCCKETALFCRTCRTWTCQHYSLWADNDPRGANGEQVVHRCNWCQSELLE